MKRISIVSDWYAKMSRSYLITYGADGLDDGLAINVIVKNVGFVMFGYNKAGGGYMVIISCHVLTAFHVHSIIVLQYIFSIIIYCTYQDP